MEFAILRPALVFGPGDILLNNIAWFLRRSPVFGVFGDGSYRVQPVELGAFARVVVGAVESTGTGTTTAVAGPVDYTYMEVVRSICAAVGSRAKIVGMPPWLALAGSRVAGFLVRDVVLSRDEAAGLMRNYLVSPNPHRVGMSARAPLPMNASVTNAGTSDRTGGRIRESKSHLINLAGE